jgi:hypothetical protein
MAIGAKHVFSRSDDNYKVGLFSNVDVQLLFTHAGIYATGPDAALGTGMLWAFTRDMQVDLGAYAGVHGDEPIATPFVGFSLRR